MAWEALAKFRNQGPTYFPVVARSASCHAKSLRRPNITGCGIHSNLKKSVKTTTFILAIFLALWPCHANTVTTSANGTEVTTADTGGDEAHIPSHP